MKRGDHRSNHITKTVEFFSKYPFLNDFKNVLLRVYVLQLSQYLWTDFDMSFLMESGYYSIPDRVRSRRPFRLLVELALMHSKMTNGANLLNLRLLRIF